MGILSVFSIKHQLTKMTFTANTTTRTSKNVPCHDLVIECSLTATWFALASGLSNYFGLILSVGLENVPVGLGSGKKHKYNTASFEHIVRDDATHLLIRQSVRRAAPTREDEIHLQQQASVDQIGESISIASNLIEFRTQCPRVTSLRRWLLIPNHFGRTL